MGTVSVTMVVNKNGVDDLHAFTGLDGKDLKQLGQHFIEHALKKTMAMAPDDVDDTSMSGTNVITFRWEASRSDGLLFGTQVNTWPALNDQAAGALVGALDGAIHQLDKRLAGKHKHLGKRKAP